jgi:glycosyltransferase involved in cell wall biosynthesis
MKNLRIIYVAKTFFPTKGAYFVQIINTCYALAERGCKVWLLVERTKDMSVKEAMGFYGLKEHPNLKVYRLPCIEADKSRKIRVSWKETFYFSAICKVLSLIIREKVDIIFLRRGLSLTKILIKLRWLLKVPIIYETHDVEHMALAESQRWTPKRKKTSERKLDKIRRLEEFVYSKVDGLVTATENLKRIVQEEFGTETKIAAIHNGIRIDETVMGVRPDRKEDIYYVGGLSPWKGVDTLVSSMKYLQKSRLIIVGGSPPRDMERLKKLVIENNLEDRIIFKGFVPYKSAREYLERARVLVLPNRDYFYNRYFSCNIKLFEYMAAAAPIVASDLPALREILKDGKSAILVKPDDPKALAEGIKKALEDEELSRRIAENAYEDVKQYTWDKRAERILEFIAGLNKGHMI